MVTSKSRLSDDELIERYFDADWDSDGWSRAEARLRDYGVSVAGLIINRRVNGYSLDELAESFDLPREAVDAAMAYYRKNKKYVDARVLLDLG